MVRYVLIILVLLLCSTLFMAHFLFYNCVFSLFVSVILGFAIVCLRRGACLLAIVVAEPITVAQ